MHKMAQIEQKTHCDARSEELMFIMYTLPKVSSHFIPLLSKYQWHLLEIEKTIREFKWKYKQLSYSHGKDIKGRGINVYCKATAIKSLLYCKNRTVD